MVAGETIMGTWINGFIGLVNCIDWARSRKLSLVDFMLMSLAFSRICLLWIMLVDGIGRVLYRDSYDTQEITRVCGHLWVTAHYFSVSFVACLNVFYFLKIARFSHPLFFWLKWRATRVVLMILLGSLVMFLFLSLPLREGFKDAFIRSSERKEEKNYTGPFQMSVSQVIVVQMFLYLGPLILWILSLTSCFLLIFSLWRHTWQMHLNATDAGDPSTEAHLRVIKWMVSLLFFTFLYYLGISINISTSKLEKRLAEVLGVAIAGVCPSGHSFILILGNSKLRRASLWVWRQALLCLRGGKP
ncbi:taste receptor type 2 member 7-like [Petaurus breviceps papuanus]|uniref:taste receptor type 2 member 7-like n=1 Tax=Petaurus breviceps papuanus TaxID=3040969 RepID=UPI0036DA291D